MTIGGYLDQIYLFEDYLHLLKTIDTINDETKELIDKCSYDFEQLTEDIEKHYDKTMEIN
jgi:hypothetical protein